MEMIRKGNVPNGGAIIAAAIALAAAACLGVTEEENAPNDAGTEGGDDDGGGADAGEARDAGGGACTTDLNCVRPAFPFCDTEMRECVQCFLDAHCESGKCDETARACLPGQAPDAGANDAGKPDAGPRDAGPKDSGNPDSGYADSGPLDAGPKDTGPRDTGWDAGYADSGPPDTGPRDSGTFDAGGVGLDPPAGGSSGGSGGASPVQGQAQNAGGITYYLIVPSSYSGNPAPLLVVFSGTERATQMTQNLLQLASYTGCGDFIMAVLDGVDYNGNGYAGQTALDDVRSRYDVDNDRTYLISESAGTTAGYQLGFLFRQSYFAVYWVNDISGAVDGPGSTAADLGFAPWGQVGPGGQFGAADQVVGYMRAAGYRLPDPAPYAGAGSNQHGSPDQFISAMRFLPGKTRQ